MYMCVQFLVLQSPPPASQLSVEKERGKKNNVMMIEMMDVFVCTVSADFTGPMGWLRSVGALNL